MRLLHRYQAAHAVLELTRNSVSIMQTRQRSNDVSELMTMDVPPLNFCDGSSLADCLEKVEEISGYWPAQATICIPRSVAILHVLELPPIGHHDLPGAISLELEALYGDDLQQYEWDYSLVGGRGDLPVYAVVACMAKKIGDALRLALEKNKIAAKCITLSELGYGSVATSHSGVVHMLALRGDRLDALVCYRGVVVQSQSFAVDRTAACNFEKMSGALRRLHASLPPSMQVLVPRLQVVVVQTEIEDASGSQGEFERTLVEASQAGEIDVEYLPLQVLLDFSQRSPALLDFAHPKRSKRPRFTRRQKIALWSLVPLLVLLTAWSVMRYESSRVSMRIDSLRREIAAIDKKLSAMGDQLESAAKLRQWEESNVDWKSQLQAISQQMQEQNATYIVRLQMDNPDLLDRKPVTRLEGRSKSSLDILQMTRSMGQKHGWLSVQPNGIEPNAVDPEYSMQFRVEVTEATSESANLVSTQSEE